MIRTAIISDLGRVVTGNTPPRNQPKLYGDYTPFIKATDISENEKHTYFPEEGYSESGHKKYIRSLIPKGSTCVVTIGSIGKKMTMAHCDCFINQAMNAIIPNEHFDKEYVYYAVKNALGNLKMLDSGTASGRENVSKSAFSKMEVTITDDIISQRKIGSILATYDDLIENNRKQIKLLEEAAQRLYKEWFVDLHFPGHEHTEIVDGVPEGWRNIRLSDVSAINANSISKDYPFDYIEYTDLSSVQNGIIKETTRYSLADAPGRAKRIANDGDVIWGMVRPNLKSFALVLNPKETDVFSTGFCVLSPKSVPFSYLYYAVTTENFIAYLVNCTNGAAYPAVKPIHFAEANLLCPDNCFLDRFNAIVEPMLRKREKLLIMIKQAQQARDRLLPKLMSGVVKV